jgi:hypothetical protein
MATAEVGALRVSLSLDSAAFTAGARAASTTAQTTATTIATSFQGAATRVQASAAAMGAAIRTQLGAGVAAQVSALRTGLLGLISPVGLLVTGAAALLPSLIGRQGDAGAAARVHADALIELNRELGETRDASSEVITALYEERQATLDAAEAVLAYNQARIEQIRAGGWEQYADLPREEQDARIAADAAMIEGLDAQIARVMILRNEVTALRGAARRAWFRETILGEDLGGGGGGGGGGGTSGSPAGATSKLSDYQPAILDKQRDFEARQTEIVRQGEEQRRALREASLSSVASIFGSLARIVGEGSERAFKISKAFSIGEAAINTGLAITKALAGPFPFITAASVAAAGAAQIVGILRAQPGNANVPAVGGGPATGGADTGGGASTAPGQVLTIRGLNRGDLFSGDSVRELAEKLVEFQRNGGKVVYA